MEFIVFLTDTSTGFCPPPLGSLDVRFPTNLLVAESCPFPLEDPFRVSFPYYIQLPFPFEFTLPQSFPLLENPSPEDLNWWKLDQ